MKDTKFLHSQKILVQTQSNYWICDYIAVGAGAHGKYRLTNDDIIRYQNASIKHLYENIISNEQVIKSY